MKKKKGKKIPIYIYFSWLYYYFLKWWETPWRCVYALDMVKWRHNEQRKYKKKPQLYKLCCHDYRILIIAIQIKLQRGQLISRIHTKTAQKIVVGVGEKKNQNSWKI